ncbi:hypothetical protein L249_0006 [Ophiocordyceps polyrhachis-furcata BCC 54312]|uniref:PSP proline-rich domain-containing protein n=1 Tax=Ophiocordyceps polyrhachis-furcata BCC 54312 TaxID=1330021 RepID=A0A367LCX9_9HYPO|nr:hypothetical protein L249_0006 [Ophiocordyceps polyrhachis-furcata BCC 54312]
MTKNQLRRAKKKEQKKAQAEACFFLCQYRFIARFFSDLHILDTQTPRIAEKVSEDVDDSDAGNKARSVAGDDSIAETSTASALTVNTFALDGYADDPVFAIYKDIFAKFGASLGEDEIAREANAGNQGTVFFDEDNEIPDEDEDGTAKSKLSKKKRKQMKTLSVAELKAMVQHPEVVEWQDVSSSDPKTLVQIKAQRNVVPVPSHWSLKREYLSSKRGIEKPPFRLPDYIAATGISEMRDAVLEKEAEQSLKQKQRARVQPKMGKLDIDYQKLYDAFFRFQTKPELTRFGEVYYEGKEAEVDFQHFRPGELSEITKEALGIPLNAPPPWLINQQRMGPPPSYPTLKIPGLNMPPPPNCSWGYNPGQWGKPPIDEFNRPLFGGDVLGYNQPVSQPHPGQPELPPGEPVERTLWGVLQPQEEESEEEEMDESDDEEAAEPEAGITDVGGVETPSGYASVATHAQGVETSISGEMDLRKERPSRGTETPSGRAAYTVLQERKTQGNVGGLFGVGHQYDLGPSQRPAIPVLGAEDESRKRKKPGDIDAAIDVDSLNASGGMSKDAIRKKFDEGTKREGIGANWQHDEELDDLIAQESSKRQKTEKERVERRREGRNRY